MSEREPWRDYERLLPDTHRLIRHVEEQTGRIVEIQPEPAIRSRGRAIYVVTDPDPDHHLILYDPAERRFLDHLVAHELGHVREFAEAEPEDRVVPIMTSNRRARVTEQLLPELDLMLRRGFPPTAVREVLPIWLSGTVAQLADTPSDCWIERRIAREYPGLRANQSASLREQAKTLHQVLDPRVAAVTPESIWIASNAMNFCLVHVIAELVDEPALLARYRDTRIRALGQELLEVVEETGDQGLAGDRTVSNRWAARLGVVDWFEWRRLDQLPRGSRHAWE